jgi:hypothetical protein
VALLGSGLALALALVRHLQQLLMGQKAPHTVSHSAEVAGGAALLLGANGGALLHRIAARLQRDQTPSSSLLQQLTSRAPLAHLLQLPGRDLSCFEWNRKSLQAGESAFAGTVCAAHDL